MQHVSKPVLTLLFFTLLSGRNNTQLRSSIATHNQYTQLAETAHYVRTVRGMHAVCS